MSDGRGELHAAVELAAAREPELAHRDVHAHADLHFIERAAVVRLGVGLDAVLAAQFGEAPIVVVRHQVGLHAAHVPEELFRGIGAVHKAAGECGKVFQRIVPGPPAELFGEAVGPVLHAHLVAVDEPAGQTALAEPLEVLEDRPEEALEVMVHRFGAVLVALEAHAAVGPRVVGARRGRVADAQNDP